MKFKCEKNLILREISIAQEIISTKNALSVLSNVLIEAQNGQLTIKASDLKVGFESSIKAEVNTAGSTTVFCDKLLGILRSLPDGEIIFEQHDQKIIISPVFNKIDFQLKSIASDKFPELQKIQDDLYFEMAKKDFFEMINQTIFSISDDETRYFMNGVFLEKQGDDIIMVATDGRRLSFIKNKPNNTVADFKSVIVPPKILNLVKKISSDEGNMKIAVNERNIFFKIDGQELSSNLIEGQFPNYKRVIPDKQENTMKVERNKLLDALKRVSLLVEQKSKRIFLIAGKGSLVLTSEESEIGSAKEELSCSYTGEEITIAINYSFIMDPLRVMESDEIEISFSEPTRAITLNSVPEKDYFHILMPMQLD